MLLIGREVVWSLVSSTVCVLLVPTSFAGYLMLSGETLTGWVAFCRIATEVEP